MNYLQQFLEMIAAEKNVSQNTRIAYNKDISDFLAYFLKHYGAKDIAAIQERHLYDYIAFLSKNHYKSRSISRKTSALCSFFAFLQSEGVLAENPVLNLERPKQAKLLPKAISEENVLCLIRSLDAINNPESQSNLRLKAMIELIYATGARVSEMLNIKIQDLNFQDSNNPYVMLYGKGRKERIALLNEHAMLAINLYMPLRLSFCNGLYSDWLFPSMTKNGAVSNLTRQRFGQLLKKVAIDAGMDPKCISPHVFRHSFGTHLLQNGADIRVVQELLGHADISSTQIYTKVSSTRAHHFVLQSHPLANKDKSTLRTTKKLLDDVED